MAKAYNPRLDYTWPCNSTGDMHRHCLGWWGSEADKHVCKCPCHDTERRLSALEAKGGQA